uniref:Striatin-3 n=1 Tax=Tetraodon nigroviridis TaxID=99883 RepID=H3CA87_TETNG
MDEHPAGGGIGAGASRQPPPQQHGGNSSANPPVGGGVMVSHQPDELPRTQQQYTIPGILHYIQHEWARFEMERAHWEVERAELQARIAFLQGERKGQENLKSDLVRRIKMLEYALKQERAKYHKLKYGKELNQGEMKMPSFDSADTKDSEVSAVPANSQLTWKQGRQLLRQYLQEVGYTDTILDVRTQRVRSLLGLAGSEQNGSVEKKNLQQLINGSESCKEQRSAGSRSPGDVLETFNFLENAEDSDEDEEEDGDLMDDVSPSKAHRSKKHRVGNEGLASEEDADTEEALKEFDFLVTAEDGEGAGEARSSGDGTEWAEPLPFPAAGGRSFLLGSDDVLESVLGLGDLAGLTVANDDTDYSYELSSCKDSSFRKTWSPRYTLRSHFDGVRALAFHPVEPCLVTVSEDHTLKLWNLTKTVPAKKSASFDVEPVYTFRGDVGPVLSLAMSSSGEQCFSGGLDSTIQWWSLPGSSVDPYDTTSDSGVLAGSWRGHTDAVWGLAYSGIKNRLLSCSADGTVKLWNPSEKSPCVCTFNTSGEYGIPTSVDFNGCDPANMVVSFNGGDVVVYDLETEKSLLVLRDQKEGREASASPHINKVVGHPQLPLTITAHEDRHINFYDNKSGRKVIHSMVAHLDAVTSLAVDPNGIYLISGSHDCSLRLWNLDSKTCVQEITAHRKKSEEAIYDVAFHPSKAFIASAGADALARVYV